jgi:glycosyltransferase involved in cell wall biosynthesis
LQRRFDRVAITSVFGSPSEPRTWSGAPFNLGAALGRIGIAVEGIHPRLGRARRMSLAARHVLGRFGRLSSSEQLLRSARARDALSLQVTEATARLGVRHVLHTGTLDLPAFDLLPGIRHYLYCDQTWDLSLQHRVDVGDYGARALDEFERLEAEAVRSVDHVFTFGRYVRDNLVEHYGLPPERVSVVGSGMGPIEPFGGVKSFAPPRLLFVAKHLFAAKGGPLVVAAFRIALAKRPDLRLTIVADPSSRRHVPRHPSIAFRARLPWAELQSLYRGASLLVQPMLNDPWGQVYLEALMSRTPVLGLDRNGLPEIVAGGRCGFLVERPDPRLIAEAILDAVADPERLARMGRIGQAHVLDTYGWDRVAAAIANVSQERTHDAA